MKLSFLPGIRLMSKVVRVIFMKQIVPCQNFGMFGMNCYGQKRCSMHERHLTFSVEVCQGWVPIGDWLRPKEGKAGKSSRLPARNTSADGEEILPVTGRVLRPAKHP